MKQKTSEQLEEKFHQNFVLLSCGLYYKNIGLAVSGGVDSIALLLLMHKLALEKNINLTVFTVNHNLRPEAFDEVNWVADLCGKLQVKCVILDWNHHNNLSNLSARAREGRYNLITQSCEELDVLTLFTAHHQDDLIETFLLKKERKSGTMALSSGNLHFHNNIRILRPLFNISKTELINYVKEQSVSWMEDSSNKTNKYLRNIIRKEISLKGPEYKKSLISDLQQIDHKTIELNASLVTALASAVKIFKFGFAIIEIEKFLLLEYEVQLRIVSYLFNVLSGNIKSCRACTISSMISATRNNEIFAKTMHGCVVKRVAEKLLIYRELGKKKPEEILARQKIIWDKRFCITVKDHSQAPYVTSLNLKDYSGIKEKIKENLNLEELKKISLNHHKAILFTLPIIKVLEKIVAMPHISYYESYQWKNNIDFSYLPSFTSRFIHFY